MRIARAIDEWSAEAMDDGYHTLLERVVGFHFSEQFLQEKAFGAAVLQHLLKTAPKSKLAAGAKNKLKTVVL